MSFNGDIIVLRSTETLSTFTPYADTPQHLTSFDLPYADGWRAVHVRHYTAPYQQEDAWVTALAAATKAPVLVCDVFESDVASVRGASCAGWWQGMLDPDSGSRWRANRRYEAFMNEHYGDDTWDGDADRLMCELEQEERDRLVRERPAAARAAVAWAAAAGYEVAVEPIEELLGLGRDPFVEALFFDLLELLGLRRIDQT